MTLLLNNEEVQSVLTMDVCMAALEEGYRELAHGRAVIRPRTHMYARTSNPEFTHVLKSMEGASEGQGVAALRLSSDLLFYPTLDGTPRRDKYPALPGGRWLGLVLLFSTENGELLAILNDGFIQRMRVGGTHGLAAKYLARRDARVMGLFGSGWQAGAQVLAHALVRPLEEIRVYSPNREHRERFAREMTEQAGVRVRAVDTPREVVRDADIVAAATNAREPVIRAEWIRPGMFFSAINNVIEAEAYALADVVVRHSVPPAQWYYASDAEPEDVRHDKVTPKPGATADLSSVIAGLIPGRTRDDQITCYAGGVGLGLQFAVVAARVVQLARERGIGRELPIDWFTQTVHP